MMKNQKEPESNTEFGKFNDDRFQPLFPPIILFDEIPIDTSLPNLILHNYKIENGYLSLTFINNCFGYIDIYLLNDGKKVDFYYHCNKKIVTFNNIRFDDKNNYRIFFIKGKRKSVITKIELNREKLGSYYERAN